MIPSSVEASRVNTSTLLHIPIQRFSCKVAHKIYGIAQTINTANYVYFLAYKELFKLRGQTADASPDIDAIVTGIFHEC